MGIVRQKGESARKFIISNLDAHPADIAKFVSSRLGISRQAVGKHLSRLIQEDIITASGQTSARVYQLRPLEKWTQDYTVSPSLNEGDVWLKDVRPRLELLPDNVMGIWQYGFTEMFNNAIDHSESRTITVEIEKTAASTEMAIFDSGVGIFNKIKQKMNLSDARHAVLELAKGKFTTDPKNHSGEGIFFTSRMFDEFQILSGEVYFSHRFEAPEDWILEAKGRGGTALFMKLNNHTARTTRKVFDKYTTEGDEGYGFNKTVVPVKLTQYGDDALVSRSQAKRLLQRFDRFKTVILDFTGVSGIGQAFADEIFRVFVQAHPETRISEIHAGSDVRKMIERARGLHR